MFKRAFGPSREIAFAFFAGDDILSRQSATRHDAGVMVSMEGIERKSETDHDSSSDPFV